MLANNQRFTPPALRNRNGRPSPIRPKSGIMSLDLLVQDAIQRQEQINQAPAPLNSPDSFASAVSNTSDATAAAAATGDAGKSKGFDGLMAAGDESVDEDAIKESPPRPRSNGSGSVRFSHMRQTSEPRPLGEVMDEVEEFDRRGAGSPSLRHMRGRLEEKHSWEKEGQASESYADAPVKEPAKEEDGGMVVNGTSNADADGTPPPIPPRAHPTLAGNMLDPGINADGQMRGEGVGVGGTSEHRVREEGLEHISEEGSSTSPSSENAPSAPGGLSVMTYVPTNGHSHEDGSGVVAKHAIHGTGTRTPETYEAVGKDESPRSPVRKAHKRVSSRSLNGSAKKQMLQAPQDQQSAQQDEQVSPKSKVPDFLSLDNSSADEERPQHTKADEQQQQQQPQQADQEDQSQEAHTTEQAQQGQLIYENLRNSSGENLASIKPSDDYASTLSLSQREESKPPTLPDRSTQTLTTTSKHTRDNSELVSGRRAGAGWSRSAIRWAPLNVPLQRRLQTFMVLLHTLSIAGGLALFFLLCTIPLLWPILLPYLLYVLLSRASVDGRLGQRSEWLRRSKIWSLFAGYYPARLHRTQELEPGRKYIFGYHPHGIISHGAFAAFGTEALGFSQLFPGITNTLLTLDANFRIPLYRDYALRMGLASVSRESCENLLSRGGPNGEGMGRAITIVVGGARESLDAKPRTLRLVLKRRKGFVKLAIRAGADLVPVLAFGENDLYDQFDAGAHPWVHRMQMGVKKALGFTVPLFHARGVFNYDVGLMPYRRPINIVVGRPIRIQQAKNPDPAYVDEMHERYVHELLRIWDEWKDTFARHRDGELEIVE